MVKPIRALFDAMRFECGLAPTSLALVAVSRANDFVPCKACRRKVLRLPWHLPGRINKIEAVVEIILCASTHELMAVGVVPFSIMQTEEVIATFHKAVASRDHRLCAAQHEATPTREVDLSEGSGITKCEGQGNTRLH